MRVIVVVLVLAIGACSNNPGWPSYGKPLADQLSQLAASCRTTHPDHGYDSVIDCHRPDDSASVSLDLMDDRIGQLSVEVVDASVDAGLVRIDRALTGLVDRAAFEQIARQVRRGKSEYEKVPDLTSPKVRVGAEQDSPGGPWRVSVDLDWRTE